MYPAPIRHDASIEELKEEQRRILGEFDDLHRALFFAAIRDLAGNISREVVDRLERVRDEFAAFIRLEEASDELMEVLAASPHLMPEAQVLRNQHVRLLLLIHSLAREATDAFWGRRPPMACETCLRELQEFERAFLTHQTREADLIFKALYDDQGTVD